MQDSIKDHIGLLGHKAADRVTGFEGVIDSVAFDLYGCIVASIRPPVGSNGVIPEGYWFDVTRLNVKSKSPVMDQPRFDLGYVAEGRKGAAPKTAKRG